MDPKLVQLLTLITAAPDGSIDKLIKALTPGDGGGGGGGDPAPDGMTLEQLDAALEPLAKGLKTTPDFAPLEEQASLDVTGFLGDLTKSVVESQKLTQKNQEQMGAGIAAIGELVKSLKSTQDAQATEIASLRKAIGAPKGSTAIERLSQLSADEQAAQMGELKKSIDLLGQFGITVNGLGGGAAPTVDPSNPLALLKSIASRQSLVPGQQPVVVPQIAMPQTPAQPSTVDQLLKALTGGGGGQADAFDPGGNSGKFDHLTAGQVKGVLMKALQTDGLAVGQRDRIANALSAVELGCAIGDDFFSSLGIQEPAATVH